MRLFSPDPDRLVRDLTRSDLTITTHAGMTWQGVLWDADENSLVLRGAAAINAEGKQVPADGEVLIPRRDVAYVQRV